MPDANSRVLRPGGPAESAATAFQAALAAQRAGRLEEAEAAGRRALALDPKHADALHLLALLLHRRGESAQAERLLREALAIREDAVFLGNLGPVLKRLGRVAEAEAAYRRALELDPAFPEAHYNLGNVLKDARDHRAAEAAYRKAVELKPDYAEAHANLGMVLYELACHAEAEAAFRRALELRPDSAEMHNNLGNLLKDAQRPEEAEAEYRRAIELKPDHAEAHSNLGVLLKAGKRFAEAEAAYRAALRLKPDNAVTYNNLGVLMLEAKRLPEAEEAFRSALRLRPGYVEAPSNLGNLLQESRRPREAEEAYQQALALQPDHAEARWNLSLLLLSQGRYAEAWPLHEARYDPSRSRRQAMVPELPFPQWRGEPLAGRSLVVWTEQGFGDNIQFCRYARLLKARGLARLTFVCRPPLRALLESVEGIDAVISDGESLPPHDYWSFPLSLPLYFSTTLETIPADLPYLRAAPARVAKWRARLPEAGLKVGLVWTGSATHRNDAERSLPGLATLAPLWGVEGVRFFSLDKGRGEEEARRPPPGQPIVALGAEIGDFADTAAIVSLLDLVICVDTAVAHLAGGMGKPCWVLLPAFGTDWRWMRDRADSPWYPGVMRLVRQSSYGDWSGPVAEAVAALHAWRGARQSAPPAPLPESAPALLRPEDAAVQEHRIVPNVPGVTSISMQRRLHDARFATRYFRGDGIDVGGGIDSLALFREFFPLMRNLFVYDRQHGDAQLLANVADRSFDFLYSSHCLEHLRDPHEALRNWLRVVRAGGHLVVQVPDEDLYEQGVWPSRYNRDHKLSFTICKAGSWSPVSVNVLDLVRSVCDAAQVISVQLIDHGYRYALKGFDQTRTPLAEAGIEFVLRKL